MAFVVWESTADITGPRERVNLVNQARDGWGPASGGSENFRQRLGVLVGELGRSKSGQKLRYEMRWIPVLRTRAVCFLASKEEN